MVGWRAAGGVCRSQIGDRKWQIGGRTQWCGKLVGVNRSLFKTQAYSYREKKRTKDTLLNGIVPAVWLYWLERFADAISQRQQAQRSNKQAS